ncbi:MAG TPA: VIT domain-containing protein [Steroidobacteraceae bacterium]|nr:VIT domain-containing protein [Steroidobacteraceae bacterium]
MRKPLFTLAVLLGLPLAVDAANPALLAHERGIDDPSMQSLALRLESLDVQIDVVGALAQTTLTARFVNPSRDTLEGDFTFELPEGAVVTGYALDIEGHLVDGVLVDPLKAERTYEAQVREGVDPGLARVTRGNVFSTRIFPIPEEGRRTIRLEFAAPVQPQRGLFFPLVTAAPVGEFKARVHGSAWSVAPALSLPRRMPYEWQRDDTDFVATARLGAAPLSGELRIGPVHPAQAALTSRHHNGERRMHILDTTSRVVSRAPTGRRLRVYWDRSLSRRDQDLAAERELLASHVAQSKPSSIDLVVFNSSGARVRRVTAAALDAELRGVLYRGATSFAVLDRLNAPPADRCLVFSDGVVTLDARPRFDPGCEVFAITSAPGADRGYLQRLTGAADAVLQLRTQSAAEILARLQGQGPRVVQVRGEDGRALKFVTLDGGPAGWSLISEVPVSGNVIVRIAGLGSDLVDRSYAPGAVRAGRFDAAGALWAADRIAALAAEDGAHAQFVALSRRYSVASPAMSFLVLEDAQDYVEADIAPPSNYPKELMAEYRELKAEHDRARRELEDARLDEVATRWSKVVDWWKTDFDSRANPKAEKKSVASAPGAVDAITAEDIGRFPDRGAAEALQRQSELLEEVTVTGLRGSMRQSVNAIRAATVASDIEIEMKEWNVERPYIRALNAAAPGDIDRVLAAQEQQYGDLPVFYFDVAEWLFRRQRLAEALEMLLSALDLPTANEETSEMVAERLQRYGRLDRAVWLLERAAAQTDYLPQPRRALALALARRAATAPGPRARADLQRALQLLNEVVMTPWEGDYDGIEVVSLMEANALLPRLQALGVSKCPLDARLRALLDVDLRVVIQWNTGASDMDLWVDEPSGERAIYSNPLTAIGGRLSNDMTDGYGPEEYLLRRAAHGEYRISVNVYAADVINPNGSTVVTAHLYRDFGRPGQREQSMELELKPDDAGEKLVGTFRVQ